MPSVTLIGIENIPIIKVGDNLGKIIAGCCRKNNVQIENYDVVVIAQKVVSKSEGAIVRLADIIPTNEAIEYAKKTGRTPQLCQVYIDESSSVLEVKGTMLITRHRLGFVGSNSMVDRSNVAAHAEEIVVLLPKDPDLSARIIRESISQEIGMRPAVIISDSLGRNDREGSVGMAIGIAGIAHLEKREQKDLFGNESHSQIDLVDEFAAAASIIMGQANEGIPVVLIRGANYTIDEHASIKKLII